MAKHEWPADETADETVESVEVESTAIELDEPESEAPPVVVSDAVPEDESPEPDPGLKSDPEPGAKPASRAARIVAFVLLPLLAVVLAVGAGYFWWQDNQTRQLESARAESLQAARDITVRMLSYSPETVEEELTAERELLAEPFRSEFTEETNARIIPVAKDKQVSAMTTVPAIASISITPDRAEVLAFVYQTVIVAGAAPTTVPSTVLITLDRVDDQWLISGFEPE